MPRLHFLLDLCAKDASLNDADLTSEAAEAGENDRSWSTEDRYDSLLKARIEPYWTKVALESVVACEV